MKQFLDFIANYYQIIVSAITLICSIIIFCLKKKPSSSLVDHIISKLYFKLPDFVKDAEDAFSDVCKSGEEKKLLVLEVSLSFISSELGRKLTIDEKLYFKDLISELIEKVLSTPSKKEDFECLEEK